MMTLVKIAAGMERTDSRDTETLYSEMWRSAVFLPEQHTLRGLFRFLVESRNFADN